MFLTVYRVNQKDFYARTYMRMLEYRLDICRATAGAHIEVYGRA